MDKITDVSAAFEELLKLNEDLDEGKKKRKSTTKSSGMWPWGSWEKVKKDDRGNILPDPAAGIARFNAANGTDFPKEAEKAAEKAAEEVSSDLGAGDAGSVATDGGSVSVDAGTASGDAGEGGGDSGASSGGEGGGMGESLINEAKRDVRRYFIRPQNKWAANKAELLNLLIDIGNQNCSVYSLKNLEDNDDVHKLTTDDIIYYYDNGILYDKNHVKVMDYDLYIKHEEERKKFADVNTASEAELNKEYDDRLIDKDEPKQEAFKLDFNNLTEAKEDICCICGEPIVGYGNNLYPVRKSGRCCDGCNLKFVIPARLAAFEAGENTVDTEDED